jgi:3-oxoacyl-(acyl-carrier-protein) synthase
MVRSRWQTCLLGLPRASHTRAERHGIVEDSAEETDTVTCRRAATWEEVRGGWSHGEGVGILFVEQREEAKISAPLAQRAALARLAAMDYGRSTPAAQGYEQSR